MKRSEMIEKIREVLYSHIVLDYHDIQDDDFSIGQLLKAIEKAGMIPPRVEDDGPKKSYVYHNFWEVE